MTDGEDDVSSEDGTKTKSVRSSHTRTIPSWVFLLPSLQQLNLANNNFTGIEISKPLNIELFGVSNVVVVVAPVQQAAWTDPVGVQPEDDVEELVSRRKIFKRDAGEGVLLREIVGFRELRGQLPGDNRGGVGFDGGVPGKDNDGGGFRRIQSKVPTRTAFPVTIDHGNMGKAWCFRLYSFLIV
ncbi:hypothetical protein L1987_13705 [Smallanthus sonchifolius]|uniref:Uncharacterized protein n=1 Tax=Smallanthus sonchifolius TaxID=185202 RepID=A0ACB9JIT9_9ASTR|nr:hypothetical protein L1987_13705 [Smallanthus sonchifolius]